MVQLNKQNAAQAPQSSRGSENESIHDFDQRYRINPNVTQKPELRAKNVLLSVDHLRQNFYFGKGINKVKNKAVNNVCFDLKEGECLGIVGESGCGKTTTGRCIMRLYDISSGSIYYRGVRISAGSEWNKEEIAYQTAQTDKKVAALNGKIKEAQKAISELKLEEHVADTDTEIMAENMKIAGFKAEIKQYKQELAKRVQEQKRLMMQNTFDNKHVSRKLLNEIQMIFQDPVDSLDPRMTVEDIIQEGLRIQGYRNRAENHEKVVEMLKTVGLVEEHASRYPHEFSGGQKQRVGIARALIMNPKLLICDEPISALDVSIRAQIINLLNDLKRELNLSLIFIAHDLSVVKYFCDSIVVMYYGKVVEKAPSDELFKNPLHPYTRSLLSAIPKPNPRSERQRKRITYNPATEHNYSAGERPVLREIAQDHFVYCSEAEFERYKTELK